MGEYWGSIEKSYKDKDKDKYIYELEYTNKVLRMALKSHGELIEELHETKLKLKYYQEKYGYHFKSDGKTLDI